MRQIFSEKSAKLFPKIRKSSIVLETSKWTHLYQNFKTYLFSTKMAWPLSQDTEDRSEDRSLFCCGGGIPPCFKTATDFFRSLLGCGREDETLQEDIAIISGQPAAEERNLDNCTSLDNVDFLETGISWLERRGFLETPGLYRTPGVASKVNRLLAAGFENPDELDSKVVSSAIKSFLRRLPEPLLTFELYESLIRAADLDSSASRLEEVRTHYT